MGQAVAAQDVPENAKTSAIGTPVVVVSRTGLVAADLPCRKCFTNLLGSSVNGRCPDCSAAVGISVYGELVRYGKPAWVRSLAKGAGIGGWGVLLGVAAAVASATVPGPLGKWLGPVFAIAAGLVLFRGASLLTKRDPSWQVTVGSGAVRWFVRFAMVVWVASRGVHFVPLLAPHDWMMSMRLLELIAIGAGLFGVAGQFALLHHVNLLALRIPNAALSRRARIVRPAYSIALIAATMLPAVMPHAAAYARYAGYATIVALFALLVYGVMALVLLNRLQRALAIQADYAQGIASRARPS
jgi:hypothetical protein